jgi:hypothetical protein
VASSHPDVILHIGCRKSGTSYLQQALHRSREALTSQGLEIPLGRRAGHVRGLLDPLRRGAERGEAGPGRRAVRGLLELLEQAQAPRCLVTLEDLAELHASATAQLLDGLSEHRVKVVVTARHWGLSIPSEWQQSVKERLTTPYVDFIEQIRVRDPRADRFIARQDLADIVARWGSERPGVEVVVLAVPPSSSSDVLAKLYCSELGVDPATLSAPGRAINQSLDYPSAELLRRLNVALGDRLTDIRGEYRPAVRLWLTRPSLMKGTDRERINLPAQFASWVHDESQRQLEALRARGVRLVGDENDLLAPAESAAPNPAVSEERLNKIAVDTLADLVSARWEEKKNERAQDGG